jgi:acylglycerol lipase
MGEHSGRHLNTVRALTEQGAEVIRFDLRGHGESGGERQWISRFEDYVDDVSQIEMWSVSECDPLPLFVLGHSMGGAIAVHFAAASGTRLSGLALSSPAFRTASTLSPGKIRAAKILAKILPHTKIAGALDIQKISRDPAVVEAFRNDPYVYRFNTLRQGAELLRAFSEMPEKASRIKIPTLILHGSADAIVLPSGSEILVNAVGHPDKKLEPLPEVFHEPHNDWDKENFFKLLSSWITARA